MRKVVLGMSGAVALAAGLAGMMFAAQPAQAGYCGCPGECQRRCAVDVSRGVESSQNACEKKWAQANVAAGRVSCSKNKKSRGR